MMDVVGFPTTVSQVSQLLYPYYLTLWFSEAHDPVSAWSVCSTNGGGAEELPAHVTQ